MEQHLSYSSQRLRILALLSAFSIGLFIFRVVLTGNLMFGFLLWNLFLAWIPLGISIIIQEKSKSGTPFYILLGWSFIWLLFFPNAPYIITDYIHLQHRMVHSIWLDVLIISSFALTGLACGLYSLRKMQVTVTQLFGGKAGVFFVIGASFLAAFGVYLGRFLRWNSWDLVQNPGGLIADIFHRIIFPADHPQTWAITLILGSLLTMLFFLIFPAVPAKGKAVATLPIADQ